MILSKLCVKLNLMEPAKVRKEDIVLKHLMCAALLASALLAAGCLTGCSSLYDPSDVEDPAGVGTSALLGEGGTEALAAIYKDALAQSGLEAGGDQRV